MSATYRRVNGGLEWIETAAVAVAGVAMVIAMVLVTCDAILRHLFAAPLTFQFQLTESYLMVIGIMLALPWGYRTGGRIQIAGLVGLLPQPARGLVFRLGMLASAAYVSVLGFRAWLLARDAFANGDYIMGVIDWPVGWSWIWVPVGCGLLALRLLVDAAAPGPIEPAGHG